MCHKKGEKWWKSSVRIYLRGKIIRDGSRDPEINL